MSENIADVLASVEQQRDELEDAMRQAIDVLQKALMDECSKRPTHTSQMANPYLADGQPISRRWPTHTSQIKND